MKKKVFASVVILFVIAAIISVVIYKKNQKNTQPNLYDDPIGYFNHVMDFKLLVYGDDIEFREEFEYQRIYDLKDETVFLDADCVYLIINDLGDNVRFDESDCIRLKEYADRHQNFNFYYIGAREIKMVAKVLDSTSLNPDDCSLGYVIFDGSRVKSSGLWTGKDTIKPGSYNLGDGIINSIAMEVGSNE